MKLIRVSVLPVILIGTALMVLLCNRHSSPSPFEASADTNSLKHTQTDEDNQNRKPLELPLSSPKIVIAKSKRQLKLFSGNELLRTYRIGLGLDPVNNKVRAGDRRTPEGAFYICLKNSRSNFYLSLQLSYPNQQDAERGLRNSLITRSQYDQIGRTIRRKERPPQNTALGGDIFIHGNGSQSDWTWGCIALDDTDMKELFEAVALRTPVIIEH